ncbi:hypothetical protein ACFQ5J_03065 [Lacticaseibacillus baoqingensis]|uniref:Uncharacterized protein n=1 Tax=Lacticaseibacillus baoqingensis TaxID=2486013 RepID=A0ABW4E2Q6_9LACO|nr:hypothetical protein [Lacticaseibacillus baoqingensis]
MKLSFIKLPALFGVVYAAFTVVVLIVATIYAVAKGFSLSLVGETLMAWEAHWWWLSIIGGLLHLLSYIKSRTKRLMWCNWLGMCLYIGYVLIPNYSLILVVVHFIVIYLIATTKLHHPDDVQVPEA